MQNDIKQTWSLSQPPEIVWEYLTKEELIAQWLMKNDFKPVVGHQFMFHTKPLAKRDFDGRIYCEVLEVVPFKKLSYSWKGGPHKGKITLDSVVTWTLLPKNGGTELLLEHSGFKGMKNFVAYFFMNAGWKTKIRKRFVELVNTNANATAKN
jgi:uncharacterized protein YndB with AHSA1/START domain